MCSTVRSMCDWHQCLDLVELIVALLCIPGSAAHVRGLSSSTHLCSGPGQLYLQIIKACISVHDQYRPSSLLQSQTMGGCRVCRMLAKLFLQNGAWTRFSESTVIASPLGRSGSRWITAVSTMTMTGLLYYCASM